MARFPNICYSVSRGNEEKMRTNVFTRNRGIRESTLLLCLIAGAQMARADLIIGNLPLSGQWIGMSIANHSGGWKYYQAQGFTIGDYPVQLVDVVLNLSLGGWGIPAFPPIADLYSDANDFLGAHLTSLEPVLKPCFPCDIHGEDYVFRPQTPILMQPHQTYWIRASVHDLGFYYWNASLPDQIPAGPYSTAMQQQWTFFRGFWETNQDLFGGQINSGYEVHGIPQPEPGTGTLFLVAAGLWSCIASRARRAEPAQRLLTAGQTGHPD